MTKIRIKATGKTYELGNRLEASEARCSSLSCTVNVSLNCNYVAAKKVVKESRKDPLSFMNNGWTSAYNFKDELGSDEEGMIKRYGDLADYVRELIDKYDEAALFTSYDGCVYDSETDTLYADAFDDETLGYYAFEEDNLFYSVHPEDKFYLPQEIELIDE
ncbi:MAG: hypothetical protein PHN38_09875 [Sulfurospirillaceae bacterium]|nr:hypothetical protein [Sulfurospirillaceae bacterium]